MRVLKEWDITAPWGKIAMVSWGNPSGEPVLLVHGREDSVSTFKPLLQLLPDKYHYVGFDLPGHGRSDPFPHGVMVMRFHFISAVEVAVKHLGWTQFIYMAHSMGTELGLFYNAIHPHRIKKFVHLDPGPTFQSLQFRPVSEYYQQFYGKFYNNYKDVNKMYTKRRALDAVMKARGLTEELAELILERNLNRVGDDLYRLSWDKRLKYPAPINLPNSYYLDLFTRNAPPTLFIRAIPSKDTYPKYRTAAIELALGLSKYIKDFQMKVVQGNHDVHLIHPERFSEDIVKFLEKDFGVASKL